MVTSVLRSHLDDVSEREAVCHRAVLRINGVFGSKNLAIANGDVASMVSTELSDVGFWDGLTKVLWIVLVTVKKE